MILLPLGFPLLGYARRPFTLSLKLMVPRAVSHPIQEGGEGRAEEPTQGGEGRAEGAARHQEAS